MKQAIKLKADGLRTIRTVDPRLRKLAKELGSVWIRMSGMGHQDLLRL